MSLDNHLSRIDRGHGEVRRKISMWESIMQADPDTVEGAYRYRYIGTHGHRFGGYIRAVVEGRAAVGAATGLVLSASPAGLEPAT